MKRYQRLYINIGSMQVAVSEPPPWYQLQFCAQRREQERHNETIADIRGQLQAAATGSCSPEVALLTIAGIIQNTASTRGTGEVKS